MSHRRKNFKEEQGSHHNREQPHGNWCPVSQRLGERRPHQAGDRPRCSQGQPKYETAYGTKDQMLDPPRTSDSADT